EININPYEQVLEVNKMSIETTNIDESSSLKLIEVEIILVEAQLE
ncbi:3207_t:CDS:1, partial [Scutellospora calospora]